MGEFTLVAVAYTAAILAVAASFALVLLARHGRLSAHAAWQVLAWAALAGALLAGVAMFAPAADDSGTGFAIAVTGIPMIIAVAPIATASVAGTPFAAARVDGTAVRIVSWVTAVVMLAFAVLFLPSLGSSTCPRRS